MEPKKKKKIQLATLQLRTFNIPVIYLNTADDLLFFFLTIYNVEAESTNSPFVCYWFILKIITKESK